MSLVKRSYITEQVSSAVSAGRLYLKRGMVPCELLFGCARRAVSILQQENVPDNFGEAGYKWRCKFFESEDVSVVGSDYRPANSVLGMVGRADLVIDVFEEVYLVNLHEAKDGNFEPVMRDIVLMVMTLELSEVDEGLVGYFDDDSIVLHYVSPDFKETQEIMDGACKKAAHIIKYIRSDELPDAKCGADCNNCHMYHNCDSVRAEG